MLALHDALAQPYPVDPAAVRRRERALYDALVAPVEADLAGQTELVVVPDGALGMLPFEALVGPDGRYLAERFAVRYVQSLAVRDVLARRHYAEARRPLLACGGAAYAPDPGAPAAADPDDAARRLAPLLADTVARGGSLRFAYEALGLGRWPPLPGTLTEVQAIAALQPGARLLTGAEAAKHTLQALSASGELASYRVLHLATHGVVVPELPELNGLCSRRRPTPPTTATSAARTSPNSSCARTSWP